MKYLLRLPLAAACGLVLTLCLPALAQAATLNVPSSAYPTIQSAVNAASNGDTVLIADGTYTGPGNVDIDFNGKNLTVTSQHGAASTIINCQGSSSANHRGFYLHSGETSAVISGLTIENGYTVQGGSDPNNGYGGGISLIYVGAVVQNCVVTRSTAQIGGGIYDFSNTLSTARLTGCTVTGNTATLEGGGISNGNRSDAAVVVENCIVSGDSAGASGGGIYNSNDDEVGSDGTGTVQLTNCTITNNAASGNNGGGVDNINGTGIIKMSNCIVSSNNAQNGGGLYNENINSASMASTIQVANCVITGNTANSNGGGGISDINELENGGSSTIEQINCTVTGNTAPQDGGVYSYNYRDNSTSNPYSITLTNTILYGDTGSEIGNETASTSNAAANNCDVQGGYPGTGNINADPQFASTTDLHLKPGSPCVSAGTATSAPATDKDGNARPIPPSIGAYDVAPAIATSDDIFVSSSNGGPPSTIEEYTPNGQHVRSIAVPNNTGTYAAEGTEYLRGIAVSDAGQIVGFNGTFSPQLTTFLPNTYTFTARTAPGWDISNSVSSGSVGVYGAYSFVLSDNIDNPPADIIRFNPDGTSQQFGAALNNKNDINLTVGLDGKLYVLYSNPSNGFLVDVYDPTSLALLRTVTLQVPSAQGGESTTLRNLAVDASGSIYAIDLYNYVYHMDASGNLLQSASHGHGGYTDDIKIDPVSGHILISVNSYNGIVLQTDAALTTFTTLIQLDPTKSGSSFLAFGNANLAAALNGTTHLLWKNTGGQATVWTVSTDGSVVSTAALANSGMNPLSIADGTNGSVQLLWKSPAGAASVWTIAPDGTHTSTPAYGPYGDWQAQALAVGSDNLTRLFWKNSTGSCTVWTIGADSTVASTAAYGPYPSGSANGQWQAQGLAVGADNRTRLFWKDTQGEASVWTLAADGTYTATPAFGPYGDWQAQALAVGPDDLTRLLWKNTAGSCTVWTIGLDGIPTSTNPYGPYPSAASSSDWQAQAFAVGADDLTRLFWKDAAGSCTVWSLGTDGTPSSTVPYGPYGDWQATALSAGN